MSRIHNIIGAGVLAALALTGPAHAANSNQAQQKQQAFAAGPDTLSGTVAKAPTNGQIAITPFGQTNPVTFSLGASAPVFQGSGTITDQGLMPGTTVRLHYTPGATPTAAAVEVLTPQEAQAEKAKPQQLVATAAPTPTPATPSAPVAVNQGSQVSSQFKKDAEKNSDGSQAGRVLQVNSNGYFMLDPYQTQAGNARLTIASNTPVFSGNQQLSTTALKPGEDVRVFYKHHGSSAPSVVAIEVLDKNTAQQVEKMEKNLPNHTPGQHGRQ